jgi:exopolysaccharide biosynthesis polyprenyl glycosylphosphotransferase
MKETCFCIMGLGKFLRSPAMRDDVAVSRHFRRELLSSGRLTLPNLLYNILRQPLMISLRRQLLLTTFKIYDTAIMVFCFLVAAAVVSHFAGGFTFGEFLAMRIKLQNFAIFVGFVFIWHVIFTASGLYHSKGTVGWQAEVRHLIKAVSFGTLIVSICTVLFNIKMVTPVFIFVFWYSCVFLTLTGRLILMNVLKWMKAHGQNLRYLLIVGTGEKAVQFAGHIESKPELGYHIIGFVAEEESTAAGAPKGLKGPVTSLPNLPSYVRNTVIDEVAVCLPLDSYYREISSVIALCEVQGVVVRIVSELFNLKHAKSKVEEFEGDTVITVYTGDMEGWPIMVKRCFDFVFSFLMLLLLMPLLLITAVILKATSSGPVFFVQERVGLGKRKFRMYKFRTMVPDAEKMISQVEHLNIVDGPAFKIADDPRVTLIGRTLRKTRIDELPQLLNVLKGDMSLVGPRPLTIRDYEGFSEDWQRRRFSVRPGLTCLWQVSDQHSMTFEKWMELDMEYIDRWSLWLDLKILVMTIPATVKGI